MQKVDFVYRSGNTKIEFARGEPSGETELFILWELYQKKKRTPTATFLQAKWVETNLVMHLTSNETNVREYFRILRYEKTEEGKQLLKNKFNKYLNL